MTALLNEFTSTGSKFFAHQTAMEGLRNGKGQPITTHVMLTDICNHSCAFCSVQARAGDSLDFATVTGYLDILLNYDLKSVILSGGGNPILYRCKKTGKNFNDVVDAAYARGLDIGLITNGMPLKPYEGDWDLNLEVFTHRYSWLTVTPRTLDRLTWIRISMSGLDHEEKEVFVPDVDRSKTALGFSYVAHDIYDEPADPHHGKVSRKLDLISNKNRAPARTFEERLVQLRKDIQYYTTKFEPRYVRLLPNCLEPDKIPQRCHQLEAMARVVNFKVNREVCFVQQKPPKAPKACYLGYVHPVLNCDGYVYPCDSCVLNEAAEHQFANPWRICKWDQIGKLYESPVKSLIADPAKTCPGCVFSTSNGILDDVVSGRIQLGTPSAHHEHVNFV